jgi:hypothetical protein
MDVSPALEQTLRHKGSRLLTEEKSQDRARDRSMAGSGVSMAPLVRLTKSKNGG